jgi:hypothetical protein
MGGSGDTLNQRDVKQKKKKEKRKENTPGPPRESNILVLF